MGKIRRRTVGQRQQVTGLIVGKGVNVRRAFVRDVRGMLHAWEKHGRNAAEAELRDRHHRKHRRPGSPPVSLLAVTAGKLEFIRMVRSAGDRVYTRLWNRFAALAGPQYKPKLAVAQLPEHIDAALWLIESDDPEDPRSLQEATAFFVEGYGLVSCSHGVGGNAVASRPGVVTQRYDVRVTHRDDDRDLVRLQLENFSPVDGLRNGERSAVGIGDVTIAAGYGNYAPGAKSRLLRGHITSRGPHHGLDVLFSDHRAYSGMSGGPVLNNDLEVIGVIKKAPTQTVPGQETTILPLSILAEVAPVS